MPLYEYQCSKCGHRFEVIVKFSDPPRTKCPKCKGPLEKLLSAPAIQFKGSGWYVTDYAKKSGGGDSTPKTRPSDSTKQEPAPAAETKAAPDKKAKGSGKKD